MAKFNNPSLAVKISKKMQKKMNSGTKDLVEEMPYVLSYSEIEPASSAQFAVQSVGLEHSHSFPS